MSNPIYCYDFTLKASDLNHSIVRSELKKWARKWCFQREKGDEGYEHYQGRIHLFKKKRLCEQIKVQPFNNHCHWSPTSNNNKDNFDYVEKEDTRIAGPWTSDDPEPPYIPIQIRNLQLRNWQAAVCLLANINTEYRSINIILDKVGNIGKSILCTYMRCHGLARIVPPLNNYKDLMRMVCNMPTSKCYIFDMPRAISKTCLNEMYSAIESIRSGYAWDDRYKFTEKIMDSPQVWVFTNELPLRSLLSDDRWRLYHVVDEGLEVYTPPSESDSDDSDSDETGF